MWDRSKQKYWIRRRGNPWGIINIESNKRVADCTPELVYDTAALEKICFAESEEKLKELLNELQQNSGQTSTTDTTMG